MNLASHLATLSDLATRHLEATAPIRTKLDKATADVEKYGAILTRLTERYDDDCNTARIEFAKAMEQEAESAPEPASPFVPPAEPAKPRRGRPPGAKNRPKDSPEPATVAAPVTGETIGTVRSLDTNEGVEAALITLGYNDVTRADLPEFARVYLATNGVKNSNAVALSSGRDVLLVDGAIVATDVPF